MELKEKKMQRKKALEWFNNMSFSDQFFKTVEANEILVGNHTRDPESLTRIEIHNIYNYHHIN